MALVKTKPTSAGRRSMVKVVNPDSGEMELHSISSDGLSLWERLGMLDMATTIARNKID